VATHRWQTAVVTDRTSGADLVVVSALGDWSCAECGDDGRELLTMTDAGPLCLRCADLDHLIFLPRGDAALTRRARKANGLSAVVVRFSRARRRYERQGVLVEAEALERAEAQCLADADARARRRIRERARREAQDTELEAALADEIVALFPACPHERATEIARHTAVRGSGRVGRSAAGRALELEAVELAVVAAVRHAETRYDELLMSGVDRDEARLRVRSDVDRVLDAWRRPA
jgi:hypothetical protein